MRRTFKYKIFCFLLLSFSVVLVKAQKKSGSWIDFVNPFIGTGGHGHTFPGAAYPFGMMQLSPDTRLKGWDGCSGYHYSDSIIYGFSHTHLSGTGVPDYCDILFMPGNGKVQFHNGSDGKEGYRSVFQKSKEYASPGYYKVFLDKYQVQVQLTVNKRTGIHHYTFPSTGDQWILVDLKHRDPLIRASFTKYKENELAGYRISKAWADEQHIYFRSRFSKKIKNIEFSEDSLKIVLHFEDNGAKDLFVHVGISAVDAAGAENNLKAEWNEFNFKKMLKATESSWNEFLSRIQISDNKKDEKIIFYTALYHNLIHPSLFQDIDGRYRGMDRMIHTTTADDHYTVFSLWDTYRSTHPLYQWIYPEYNSKFIRTFLRQYRECGHLPVWELAGNETWCMIGNHAIPVIANAFHHRQLDFDTVLAREAVTNSILKGMNSGMPFMKKGFISANDESESVSKTIENCVDFAAAQSIGCLKGTPYHPEAYKNLYNPFTGFFQSKLNNKFTEPFHPKEVNHHYTEANAYQYLFGPHHDVDGMVELFMTRRPKQEPKENFRQRLDSLFMTQSDMSGRLLPDVTGLIGQYAHGNEPSHHMAYLYNVCEPLKTQTMIQKIRSEFYKNAPDGLIGNEDCGQMSSWYIFSALGFYPVNPYDAFYDLGHPEFQEVVVQIPDQKKILINAKRKTGQNQVNSFAINGRKQGLRFKIFPGDNLEFNMGTTNQQPGTYEIPKGITSDYIVKPFVKSGDRVFNDSTVVVLSSIQKGQIEYTFDTTAKKINFFNEKLIIRDKTKLFFRLRTPRRNNEWVASEFSPKPKGINIQLETRYAEHYPAGGTDALIDGLTGSTDYKDGMWQGYQHADLKLKIEFTEPKEFKKIGIRFIQDQGSWILMPSEVEFAFSTDGINYSLTEIVKPKTEQTLNGGFIEELSPNISGRFKSIKIQARNPGKLPSWHKGAGGDSWIFADEIVIH